MFNFRGDRGSSRMGRGSPEPATSTHEDWGQEWGEDWRGDTDVHGGPWYAQDTPAGAPPIGERAYGAPDIGGPDNPYRRDEAGTPGGTWRAHERGGESPTWREKAERDRAQRGGQPSYGGAGYYGDSRGGGQSFNSAQRVYPGDPGYREHPTRPQTLSGTGVGSRRPVGPKNYERPDERVLGDVCERLAQHPDVDVSDVTVDVDKGVVKLGGTVRERREKYLIEEVTDAIYGVKDVNNQIRVRRAGEQPGSAQRDSIGSWAAGSEVGGDTGNAEGISPERTLNRS